MFLVFIIILASKWSQYKRPLLLPLESVYYLQQSFYSYFYCKFTWFEGFLRWNPTYMWCSSNLFSSPNITSKKHKEREKSPGQVCYIIFKNQNVYKKCTLQIINISDPFQLWYKWTTLLDYLNCVTLVCLSLRSLLIKQEETMMINGDGENTH